MKVRKLLIRDDLVWSVVMLAFAAWLSFRDPSWLTGCLSGIAIGRLILEAVSWSDRN